MKAWSLIFGYFCINLGIWSLNLTGLFPVHEAVIDPTNISSLFALDLFSALAGVVGCAVIGIMALITRSYALSGGVLLVWIVGVLFKPIQTIFVGLPYLINMVLPPPVQFFSQAFVALAAVMLFILIVEILAGREIW